MPERDPSKSPITPTRAGVVGFLAKGNYSKARFFQNPQFLQNLAIAKNLRYYKKMGIKKYKYYFKKPKSEIAKDILYWLMVGGVVAIAATSPFFLTNFLKCYKKWKRYPKKKLSNIFYRLRKQGLIKIEKKGRQIFIHLTKEGKKKAGRFQINDLKIKRPKRWDGKWRIVIFDISELKKIYREAFRGKLKELGFYPLQKSVWVHAFDCQAEIELLREFFGLTEKELRLIITENIGGDKKLKQFFKIL